MTYNVKLEIKRVIQHMSEGVKRNNIFTTVFYPLSFSPPLPLSLPLFLPLSQTLLETTTSLLNSDLHWSLSQLRAAVSRGLHPRQDHCNICLQQYKRRQESQEEIIIFRCSHTHTHVHIFTLEHFHNRRHFLHGLHFLQTFSLNVCRELR